MRIFRDLREDNDKTQQEIATYLGTSQTMYARYERGANELPLRHFIALCAPTILYLKKEEILMKRRHAEQKRRLSTKRVVSFR